MLGSLVLIVTWAVGSGKDTLNIISIAKMSKSITTLPSSSEAALAGRVAVPFSSHSQVARDFNPDDIPYSVLRYLHREPLLVNSHSLLA